MLGFICVYALSVLSFIGSVCAPDKATLKAEAHALQCTTAGPYNAFPTYLLGVSSVCGLGPDLVGIHSISLAPYRTARLQTRSTESLRRSRLPRRQTSSLSLHSAPRGKRTFLLPPCPVALWMLSMLYVVWSAMAHLMRPHKTRSKRLQLDYFVINHIHRILLGQSPCGPPKLWDPSAAIEPRMKLASRASSHPLQRALHGSKISR